MWGKLLEQQRLCRFGSDVPSQRCPFGSFKTF
jgi:hypothetical protein